MGFMSGWKAAIDELPHVDANLEPRSKFAQPAWDDFMSSDKMTPMGELAPMLRYLYARCEMLEERLAKVESRETK